MEPLHEALRLIKRQTELESAMRRPGGIRVTEERELHQLRGALSKFPAAVSAIMEAAARMRRPVDTISAEDVERLDDFYISLAGENNDKRAHLIDAPR